MKTFYIELDVHQPHRGPARKLNVTIQSPDYDSALTKLLAFDLGVQFATDSAMWVDMQSMSQKPTRGRDYFGLSLPALKQGLKG